MNMTKKLISLMLLLLAILALLACGNDDEPDNKQTIDMTFNALMIDLADESHAVFYQSNGQAEIDYTNMTIQFSCSYKDLDGQTSVFKSQRYDLEPYKETVYYMLKASSGTYGVSIRPGLIDLSTSMIWYKENDVDQGTSLYITTQYTCPYLTTSVTDKNGHTFSHTKSGYMFAFDSKGEKAVMRVTDFIPDSGGAIQAAVLDYEGLTVTKALQTSNYTYTMYRITADHATCRQSDYYDLTDLDINITEQGRLIKGSYKINGNTYKMSGGLFPE